MLTLYTTVSDVPVLGTLHVAIPTLGLSDSDLAYLAGLFDGEGTIGTTDGTGFQLTIASSDHDVLYWLKNTFGGSVHIQPRAGTLGSKLVGKWSASHVLAKQLAAAILPFSRMDRRRKALAAVATTPTANAKAIRGRPTSDEDIQRLVDHFNAVAITIRPERELPFTIERWRMRASARIARKKAVSGVRSED